MTLNFRSHLIRVFAVALLLATAASLGESMHVDGTFKPSEAFTHIADFGFLSEGKADIALQSSVRHVPKT